MSPLFRNFARDIALKEFQKSELGKAVRALKRAAGGRSIASRDIGLAVNAVADLLSGQPTRYSKFSWGAGDFMKMVMGKLGPVGSVIGALLRPNGKRLANDIQDELNAAAELLRQFGYTVSEPNTTDRHPSSPMREEVRAGTGGAGGGSGDDGGQVGPSIEGMIPVTSSNVHSIGYEWPTADHSRPGNLMVRYLAGKGPNRHGEGSLYRYFDVPYHIFESFQTAVSKGGFVWDELRVRGTVSGHQYAYDLAGTSEDGYIPRQAGLKRGKQGEWYMRRSFQGRYSPLPERQVRGTRGAMPGWGRADELKFRAGRRQ